MTENTLFILNPNSGNGRGEKLLPRLKANLKKSSYSTEIIITEYSNHARNIVEALQSNFRKIVVVGGDGTLNEALNGFNDDFRCILGVIPSGSGNDFAKTVGMTSNFEFNLDIIENSSVIKEVDFGEINYTNINDEKTINSRRFINSAGIGFDALVSDMKNKSYSLKGLPQYILAVFKALKQYSYIKVDSNFDNTTDFGEKLLIAISNGKTYGGGIKVNPSAEIDDGYLNACIINPMPIIKVVKDLHKFISGTHNELKEIKLIKFSNASMKVDKGAYIHTDGEVISSCACDINLAIHSKKLKFMVSGE